MPLVTEQYSGVVVNQNRAPAADTDYVPVSNNWVRQEFFLPADFTRGSETAELRTPSLSGLQLFVGVQEGFANTAALDYKLEYLVFGVGWIKLIEGTAIGVLADRDKVWMDLYFGQPLKIATDNILNSRFRFSVKGQNSIGQPMDVPVTYVNNTYAIVNNQQVPAALVPNQPFPFVQSSTPMFLLMDDAGNVTYSVQQGIDKIWASHPNPLAGRGNARAYSAAGAPLQLGGQDISFCFRVLGLTADEGTDFLGNRYRSIIVSNSVDNTSTVDSDDEDRFWLSKPNPSRFAVESLYFDVSDAFDNAASVVDSVLVDPLTPGVYFNVYYSTEGTPVDREELWENKLWQRVPRTFKMEKRDTYVLPEPIVAKYVKIEFTHLQARSYSPGSFQKPIRYKKHPKWVLDYFLLRLEADTGGEQSFVANRVGVVYNALDLAYNYYLDDISTKPDAPVDIASLTQFYSSANDLSDRVDQTTLDKIKIAFQPFLNHPGKRSDFETIIGEYVNSRANEEINYPTETRTRAIDLPTDVSTLNKDRIVFELDYPVMFFFLTARHKYREAVATFAEDRAYFVGIRQISFTRERYTTAHDTDLYIEPSGDLLNIETNDFVRDGDSLVIGLDEFDQLGALGS